MAAGAPLRDREPLLECRGTLWINVGSSKRDDTCGVCEHHVEDGGAPAGMVCGGLLEHLTRPLPRRGRLRRRHVRVGDRHNLQEGVDEVCGRHDSGEEFCAQTRREDGSPQRADAQFRRLLHQRQFVAFRTEGLRMRVLVHGLTERNFRPERQRGAVLGEGREGADQLTQRSVSDGIHVGFHGIRAAV